MFLSGHVILFLLGFGLDLWQFLPVRFWTCFWFLSWSRSLTVSGLNKDYFDRHGDLKSIRRLKLTLFLCKISDWILAHMNQVGLSEPRIPCLSDSRYTVPFCSCFFLYYAWYLAGGKLLLKLDRLLHPGGYFVWSATPVYQKLPEDVEIWEGIIEYSDINSFPNVVMKL